MRWPLILPLVVFVGEATALDSTDPDPRLYRDDRRDHAIAGAAIGAVSRVAVELVRPEWSWWKKDLAAVAVAAAAGVAREVLDANRSSHSSDVGDAVATVVGGTAGVVLIDITFHL